MADNAAVARPYAQATFELAQEAGQLGDWSDALHAAATVVSDAQVAELIGAPGTDTAKLVDMIRDISAQAAPGADATAGDLDHYDNGQLGFTRTQLTRGQNRIIAAMRQAMRHIELVTAAT